MNDQLMRTGLFPRASAAEQRSPRSRASSSHMPAGTSCAGGSPAVTSHTGTAYSAKVYSSTALASTALASTALAGRVLAGRVLAGRVLAGRVRVARGLDEQLAGRSRRGRSQPARRGVILLVVMVLLALFTMLMLAFVIATISARQGAFPPSLVEQTGDPPSTLLHDAFMQVVRGPRNDLSVIGPHSFLEDIYGTSTRGTIDSSGTVNQIAGDLYQFTSSGFPAADGIDTAFGYYAGLVITMLDGPAAGRSSRVVAYRYDTTTSAHTFQVLSFDGSAPAAGNSFVINGRPFSGTGFGYSSASLGIGGSRLLDASYSAQLYDSSGTALSAPSQFQFALLPNPRRGVFNSSFFANPAGLGGANEDYDAVDFQNMLLAMRVWSPSAGSLVTPLPSLHRPDLINYWVTWWLNTTGNTLIADATDNTRPNYAVASQLVRQICLRPLPTDHPSFSGSNGSATTTNLQSFLIGGPWDVDNDGDGVPDSVWVDLGMPVQTAQDGRRYKPLFAILCIDMDGKLNLNAHSSWRHSPSTALPLLSRFNSLYEPYRIPTSIAPPVPQGYLLHVGSGYGPPEISLHPVFEPSFTSGTTTLLTPSGDLTRLLGGDTTVTPHVEGRYGEVNSGLTNPSAGITGIDDPFNWMRETALPGVNNWGGTYPQKQWTYLPFKLNPAPPPAPFLKLPFISTSLDMTMWNNGWIAGAGSSYGTPPDVDGDGMIALDLRGQPMYIDYGAYFDDTQVAGDTGWGEPNEAIDNAYELDLSFNAPLGYSGSYSFGGTPSKLSGSNVVSIDAPFTAAELERILRPNDWDNSVLPDRIVRLANVTFGPPAARSAYLPAPGQMQNLLTTHSYDLPVPSMTFTSPDLISNGARVANGHITQLLAATLNRNSYTATQYYPDITRLLLAPELIAGERMNINRMLGDGYDNNGNGVIDEPGETESAWGKFYGSSVAFDMNNDGTQNDASPSTSNGDLYARQNLARHLYCLMMLFADNNISAGTKFVAQVDADGDGTVGGPNDTAYYFAQLAINIVDFMDSDSIMTPFEFDIHPFNNDSTIPAKGTWEVDGYVANSLISLSSADDDQSTYPWRGLVWGCERPELLITETLATHDRRSADTNEEQNGKLVDRSSDPQKDLDFDQVRRPVGTLVVELFNPNPPLLLSGLGGGVISGERPSELYSLAPNDEVSGAPQAGVNLGLFVPGGAPVWRIVTQRLDAAIPLQAPRLPVLPSNKIDRVLYFVSQQQAQSLQIPAEGYRQFYIQPVTSGGSQVQPIIPPNHYAMIAPAATDPHPNTTLSSTATSSLVTHLGGRDKSKDVPAGNNTPVTEIHNQYYNSILFNTVADSSIWNSTVVNAIVWNTSANNGVGAYNNLNDIKRVVGVPVATLPLTSTGAPATADPMTGAIPAVSASARSVRWSITEPDGGYEVWGSTALPGTGKVLGGSANVGNENAYYDQSDPVGIPGTPYDEVAANFSRNGLNTSDSSRQTLILGGDLTGTAADKTTIGCTVLYLQRLANPLAPWEANANPYIIVDKLTVDLTSFNGEKATTPAPSPGNEEFSGMSAPAWKFDTRRRGNTAATNNVNNVYYADLASPTGSTVPSAGGSILGSALPNGTLGYLNNEYGTGFPNNRWSTSYPAVVPSTSPNIASKPVLATEYRGDPTVPFPWFNWNNRPFVSAKELLLVPMGSPSSLLSEISVTNIAGAFPPGGISPYEVGPGPQPPAQLGEFAHLPDVFHSPQYTSSTRSEFSPNFYRILEYIHVPSRFVGTETWLPPSTMSGGTNHQLHPPFNRVSRFRDPGKLNINTIFDPFVFQGLVDGAYGPGQTDSASLSPTWLNLWTAICQSRLGAAGTSLYAYYPQPNVTAVLPTPNSPTIFGAPFRSYAGHALVPLRTMQAESTAGNIEREINGTLLRNLPGSGTSPLLEYPGSGSYIWSERDHQLGNTPLADDPTRNPYFTYQAMRRWDNLVTTRSNVYAVWITVGYFEVTPAPTSDPYRSAKYPDGWVLGAEIGADTGEIKRNRGFFLYDRTIPVGFERGENHNVERGILLERFIE